MSMDNDTRLAMMNMHNEAQRTSAERPRKRRRARPSNSATMAVMSSFALTLFTRGA